MSSLVLVHRLRGSLDINTMMSKNNTLLYRTQDEHFAHGDKKSARFDILSANEMLA